MQGCSSFVCLFCALSLFCFRDCGRSYSACEGRQQCQTKKYQLRRYHTNGKDFPGGSGGKASAYNAGDPGSVLGLGRSLGKGNGNPLQYLLPGKSHRRRSLVDYSPWGHKRVGHNLAIKQQQCTFTNLCISLHKDIYFK